MSLIPLSSAFAQNNEHWVPMTGYVRPGPDAPWEAEHFAIDVNSVHHQYSGQIWVNVRGLSPAGKDYLEILSFDCRGNAAFVPEPLTPFKPRSPAAIIERYVCR